MIRIAPGSRTRNQNMLLSQGVLNGMSGVLSFLLWGQFRSATLNSVSGLLIISGLLSVVLLTRKQNQFSDLKASLIFAVNLIPAYALIWLSRATLATHAERWDPFEMHRLACLTIAILAPPVCWIGLPAILIPALLAGIQYLTFQPAVVSRLLPQRPLVSPIIFAAFSVVLYFFRLRGLWIAEFAAKKEAEANMMMRMTRTILAIKDLANSPIQALTLDAETLKRKHPDEVSISDRIVKATAQLTDLNRVLDEHLRGTQDGLGEASLDPYEVLGAERPIGPASGKDYPRLS